MAKKNNKQPVTPSLRFTELYKEKGLAKNNPQKSLIHYRHRKKGRNANGRITSRHRGGGHKKRYRIIDFKRNKYEVPAIVKTIEYDPFRSCNIALVCYLDGEKRYIIAPEGLKPGATILSTNNPVDEYFVGLSLPLKLIPPSTTIHAIEMQPGKGAQIARGAGVGAQLVSIEKKHAIVKMPSGEIRYISADCRATIGEVGNKKHINESLGKAGRMRWLGFRPKNRGVSMNPVDHPHGGGEGRTSGGGHPVSPWGQLAKGFRTRKKSKTSNSMIISFRNGGKVKK